MSNHPGIVYLVGAGPGDPQLLTVRGLHALRGADVVLYDRLAADGLLHEALQRAQRICVGKSRGQRVYTQEQINDLIVKHARDGKSVVRLKGGDPFVFGRGHEELVACRNAGIDCLVIPGITSAIAGPAAAGISITHRDHARSVTIVTAEIGDDAGAPPPDYKAWASADTLVILMGRRKIDSIAQALIDHGANPQTPAACIQQATLPAQRSIRATLATISESMDRAGIEAPCLIVIGEAAAHGDMDGLGAPLSGKRLLITRAESDSLELMARLRVRGALCTCVPMVKISYADHSSTFDDAIGRLIDYDWIAFTSAHGVEGFFRRLAERGEDARSLASCKLAVIGPATERVLLQYGVRADLASNEHTAAALATSLLSQNPGRVLYPTSNLSPGTMTDRLRASGVTVDQVIAYENRPAPQSAETLHAVLEAGVDAIVFCSPSAVERFVDLGVARGAARIACIGPITAGRAGQLGLPVDIVASPHTAAGLADAIQSYFARTHVNS